MNDYQAELLVGTLRSLDQEAKRTNRLLEQLIEKLDAVWSTAQPMVQNLREEHDAKARAAQEKVRREKLESELWKIFNGQEDLPQDFNPRQYLHEADINSTVEGYERFIKQTFIPARDGTLLAYQWAHNLKFGKIPGSAGAWCVVPMTEADFKVFFARRKENS